MSSEIKSREFVLYRIEYPLQKLKDNFYSSFAYILENKKKEIKRTRHSSQNEYGTLSQIKYGFYDRFIEYNPLTDVITTIPATRNVPQLSNRRLEIPATIEEIVEFEKILREPITIQIVYTPIEFIEAGNRLLNELASRQSSGN